MGFDIDSQGKSSVLHPENSVLRQRAEQAAIERRLAAWYYITNRYKKEEILSNSVFLKDFILLGDVIAQTLRISENETERQLANEIYSQVKEVKKQINRESGESQNE